MFGKKLVWGLVLAGRLIADEGMWLFEHLPKEQIQRKYGFVVKRIPATSGARFGSF
jgi:hypothetical protein